MKIFLAIISILILIVPVIFQIVFTIRRIRGKTEHSVFMVFLITLGLVIICTFSASVILIAGVYYHDKAGDIIDMTGILFFIFLGIIIALIVAPIIAIVGGILKSQKYFGR